jgi:hypothetical protein
VVVEELPVEEPEPEEQSAVPAPLVAALAIIALISLATSWRNPLNLTSEIGSTRTFVNEARKAVSFQRIRTIGEAIESYDLVNDDLPDQLSDLAPSFLGSDVLEDPWGNAYKFLQTPGKYLVIGFSPDGRADTDLFFSRTLDTLSTATAQDVQPTGGIELID